MRPTRGAYAPRLIAYAPRVRPVCNAYAPHSIAYAPHVRPICNAYAPQLHFMCIPETIFGGLGEYSPQVVSSFPMS